MLGLLFAFNNGRAQQFSFSRFNQENGLPNLQTQSLVQDAQGHLWIGTADGLSRFDGKTFTSFGFREGLFCKNIQSIAPAKKGDIWIGCKDGLWKFDGKKFKAFNLHRAGKSESISVIKTDSAGTTWCIAGGNLYAYYDSRFLHFIFPSNTVVTAVLPLANNSFFAALQGGALLHFHDQIIDTFRVPNATNASAIAEILQDKSGHIWIAANTGLFKISGKAIEPARAKGYVLDKTPPILSLIEDNTGALFAGMSNGAFRLKDSVMRFFNQQNGFTDNAIPSMLNDDAGNLWFASSGSGIFKLSKAPFKTLGEAEGLPAAQYTAFAKDENGKLFLGNNTGGLFAYNGENVKPLSLPLPAPSKINALQKFGRNLWIATENAGLWRYNGTYFYAASQQKTKLRSSKITTLYLDKKERLWAGAANSLSYLEKDTFYAVSHDGGSVQQFLEFGEDSLLIATTNKIFLYHNNTIYPFENVKIPQNATLTCIALQQQTLWIGTATSGLIYTNLKTGKTGTINKKNGLKDDAVYFLKADDCGNVWAGCNAGIYKISWRENAKPVFQLYGKYQGIENFSNNAGAVIKLSDSSLLFGANDGVVNIRPMLDSLRIVPVKVVLQSVEVFGKPVSNKKWFSTRNDTTGVPQKLKLPTNKNNISFNFGAVSLNGGEALLYRYKLEGANDDWSKWSKTTTVHFSALPPGKYKLVVQCMAFEDENAISYFQYRFTIITPIKDTKWFKLAVLAACVLLGIFLQFLIGRRSIAIRKRRERKLQKERLAIRTSTGEDFEMFIQTKTERIHKLTSFLRKKTTLNPDAENILLQIENNAKQILTDTTNTVWSIHPDHAGLYQIMHHIRENAEKALAEKGIQFLFSGNEEKWRGTKLSLDKSRHLMQIFKEAFENIIRYSEATEVTLEATLRRDKAMQILLKDNGKGFDLQYLKPDRGISRMQQRSKKMDGRIYIDSRKEKGTIISLTFRT